MRYVSRIIALLAIVCATSTHAKNVEYDWQYLYTYDGDTLLFYAPWVPDPLPKTISIRLLSIDTPERGFRAQCYKEREAAENAKLFVEDLMSKAKSIKVQLKDWDKYGGRLLGFVMVDGKSLSDILLETGHARPYDGGKKSDWCKGSEH